MSMSQYSTEELEAEIQQRKEAEQSKPPAKPKEDMDLDYLIGSCDDLFDVVMAGCNYEQISAEEGTLLEALLRTIYGPAGVAWWRKYR